MGSNVGVRDVSLNVVLCYRVFVLVIFGCILLVVVVERMIVAAVKLFVVDHLELLSLSSQKKKKKKANVQWHYDAPSIDYSARSTYFSSDLFESHSSIYSSIYLFNNRSPITNQQPHPFNHQIIHSHAHSFTHLHHLIFLYPAKMQWIGLDEVRLGDN